MTLALHNAMRPASVDWSMLMPAAQAAAKLGVQRDHFTRLCRDKLSRQSLAVLATPPQGGQEQWFVRRDYDPRLTARDGGADWLTPDLAGFTAKQQEKAIVRRACVEELRRARSSWPGAASEWMPRLLSQLHERFGLRVSRSALYEWDTKYRRPADLAKLIDTRGGDRHGGADAAAWDAFRDLFLHANQPSIRHVWQIVGDMAKENGWQWCSLFSCRRQLDDRIPPEVQLKHREPAKWRQKLRPFIAQDAESWPAGECYIGDHKQLDLICRWQGTLIRPWLTAWMDWRTRRITGWVLSDNPNSRTILAALRHAMQDERNNGGPRSVWIDNGRDYDAWLFHGQTKQQRRASVRPAVDEPRAHGIFNMLSIDAHFSIAFNPNGKARLERWFRTLESFSRSFATYTGDGPDTKPEQLNKILEAAHRVPAFESIYERIGAFITGYNADTDHSIEDMIDDADGVRLSPDMAMARWCGTRHVMRDPEALNYLMLHWHKPLTVGRNGISLVIRGQALHYGQFNAALTPFKAAKKQDRKPIIVAYDPHDLRSIRVHDDQFHYICTAGMNGVGGMHGRDAFSVDHVAQLNRDKATYERSLKHVAEHSLTSTLTNEERIADIAATAGNKQRASQPAALRIRQTPLDGQAKEIERDQLRVAVGAESQSVTPSNRALPSISRLLNRSAGTTPTRALEPFVSPLSQLRERRP